MEPVYSYTNDQALEDGIFADVTPPSMHAKGWKWVITLGVLEHKFSMAAYAELFNEIVTAYNQKKEINPLVSKMNSVELWLFLEADGDMKVFKIITPSEY
jgi:hypothetical protein